MRSIDRFLIADLLRGYRAHRFTPTDVIELALRRADQAAQRHVWITRLSHNHVLHYARAVEQRSIEDLPLYGISFVIKDNIDLAGVPTTAGCAEYSYVPEKSSAVVQSLLDAGAIPLGKTNLDQFATGLVGTRSPYGACRNSFNADYIWVDTVPALPSRWPPDRKFCARNRHGGVRAGSGGIQQHRRIEAERRQDRYSGSGTSLSIAR